MTKKEMSTHMMFSLMWVPYIWGGNHPHTGADCSGTICLPLREVGVIPKKDLSADMLYEYFRDKGLVVDEPKEGCLVFYCKQRPVTHIMYCLDGEWCIGAQGGNSSVNTKKIARQKDARVKILPIKYRQDIFTYVNPFKGK